MIQTWLADVSALYDFNTYKQYYERVPRFRREKADRLRMQQDKALSVGAWILREEMKSEYHLPEEFVYNLSHSGDYVLCSVEDDYRKKPKLGCDIEKIGPERQKLANRFFCESEKRWVEETGQFYRMWVLKESFLKATGYGLQLGLDAVEIRFSKEDRPYVSCMPEGIAGQFEFQEYTAEGVPYRICVCASGGEFAQDICIREI